MRTPVLTDLPAAGSRTGWPWTEETPPAPDTLPEGARWPRLSVVTPSFNQAPFLEQTLRSVLLQGYPDLEYIVIDGGSTDGSVEIIRKYEPWLAYWVSEKDRGQSHAINKGWQRSSGEILAWLNSDDYYAPRALLGAARAFRETGPDVGLVHGRTCWVDLQERPVFCAGRPFSLVEPLRYEGPAVGQPSAFLRGDLVRRLHGVAEEFHMAMDLDLYNRIALESRTAFVPEIWAYAHDWPGAKSRTASLCFGPDILESYRRLYRRKDLSPEVRSVKKEALAAAALLSAFDYRRTGRFFRMQRCFLSALAWHPRRTWDAAGGSLGLRMALGPLLPVAGALRRRLRVLGI
jgi:glycosyltransferase involved in cell wall biosynthesis